MVHRRAGLLVAVQREGDSMPISPELAGGLNSGLERFYDVFSKERGRQDALKQAALEAEMKRQALEQQKLEQDRQFGFLSGDKFNYQKKSDKNKEIVGAAGNGLILDYDADGNVIGTRTNNNYLKARHPGGGFLTSAVDNPKLNIPGYSASSGVAARPEDVAKLRQAKSVVDNIKTMSAELAALVRKSGQSVVSSADKNRKSKLYADLKVELKNAAELGALAGPDIALLEESLGSNPASMGGLIGNMFDSKETMANRFEQFGPDVEKRFNARASAFGYTPNQQPGLVGQPAQGSGGFVGEAVAAPGPKAGQVVDGYQFIGGNPSDQKSWKKVK